ncbi:hypothetical protein ACLOJK_035913 [Asimina triloba]
MSTPCCRRRHAIEDGGVAAANLGRRRCCSIDLETPLRSAMAGSVLATCYARWVAVVGDGFVGIHGFELPDAIEEEEMSPQILLSCLYHRVIKADL